MTDLNLPTTNRYQLLILLGGKCRICLEDNPAKIDLDHIYNDGDVERTKYGSNEKIWAYYLADKTLAFNRIQPLCKKCHIAKTKGFKNLSLMDGIKAYEKLSDLMTQQVLNNDYKFNKTNLITQLTAQMYIPVKEAEYLVDLYFSDHTSFTLHHAHNEAVNKMRLFLDILKKFEGDNKKPVSHNILVQELIATGKYQESEAKNYIRRMLREASIYESMPEHYNAV